MAVCSTGKDEPSAISSDVAFRLGGVLGRKIRSKLSGDWEKHSNKSPEQESLTDLRYAPPQTGIINVIVAWINMSSYCRRLRFNGAAI
jgi:hypothetical protein